MSKKAKNKRKTNIKADYSYFTEEFLRALANWQRGWSENQDSRRIIANELVVQCENLPAKFKHINKPLYRKRFLIRGEIVPIMLHGQLQEGIASWTTDLDYAKGFKGLCREGVKFAVVFMHKPIKDEVIANLILLWKNKNFIAAVAKFKQNYPDDAKPLLNFKDSQSEIILKSTLRGEEIEDIVGISHDFDELCDMANIPDEERESISKKYESDLTNIPIYVPTFAGRRATKASVKATIAKMKESIKYWNDNNIPIIWPDISVHIDDLRHHVRD